MTTVAASGLATIPLQKSQGFSLRRPSDFWGLPQSRRKIAATTAASRPNRAILRPQRPRDTKVGTLEVTSCKLRWITIRVTKAKTNLDPFSLQWPFICNKQQGAGGAKRWLWSICSLSSTEASTLDVERRHATVKRSEVSQRRNSVAKASRDAILRFWRYEAASATIWSEGGATSMSRATVSPLNWKIKKTLQKS